MSQTIILSNGDLVNVPPGANPIIFARIKETELFLAAHPKRKPAKTARKASSARPSQRSQKAAMDSVISLATMTLVERVNRRGDIPFNGDYSDYDPQEGTEAGYGLQPPF
jgi:hypothetical protein